MIDSGFFIPAPPNTYGIVKTGPNTCPVHIEECTTPWPGGDTVALIVGWTGGFQGVPWMHYIGTAEQDAGFFGLEAGTDGPLESVPSNRHYRVIGTRVEARRQLMRSANLHLRMAHTGTTGSERYRLLQEAGFEE